MDTLLAASLALTVMRLAPGSKAMSEIDQLAVPDAVPEALLAEFSQVMDVTPTLSEAVPDTLMLD
ncbi:MAG: hypothetical protein A2X40_11420 [Elusimicrobia bacterium GWC2_65_9]|nr:MAG: hypothetical protein A2X37_12040 [Elusimicrobia bacterium GWA2_66_18]OGR72137.1 MAG: hypothetical protein A2X40_11420 [Elusimicrobia bacterium GWC2_65_9]